MDPTIGDEQLCIAARLQQASGESTRCPVVEILEINAGHVELVTATQHEEAEAACAAGTLITLQAAAVHHPTPQLQCVREFQQVVLSAALNRIKWSDGSAHIDHEHFSGHCANPNPPGSMA